MWKRSFNEGDKTLADAALPEQLVFVFMFPLIPFVSLFRRR
jgi:hypothetical protein